MDTAAIAPGVTATYTLRTGRFTSRYEVTVVRYYGGGMWTIRDAGGRECQASASELTDVKPATP